MQSINEQPEPQRKVEVFALLCWRCNREVEIPVLAPRQCPICGALLIVEWRSVR